MESSSARRSTVRLISDLFPGRKRLGLLGVFGVSVVAAVFEAVGVASILPFMALVLDPSAVERYAALRKIVAWTGAQTVQETLLTVGIATALIVAFGNFAAAVNILVQQRFVARTDTRLATTIFAGYVRQPYTFHVHRDTPSLLKVLNSDIASVVSGVVLPTAQAVSRLFVGVGILLLLVAHDPLVAVTVAFVLTASYAVTFRIVRRLQYVWGAIANSANSDRVRLSQESLGGIKELQILGRTEWATQLFADASQRSANARASGEVAGLVPRFVLETVAFGGILLITLGLIAGSSGSAESIVPLLALYAFAGYRLLPAVQTIYSSVMAIRFFRPVLEAVHADFIRVSTETATTMPAAPAIRFHRSITLRDVSFCYDGASRPALRNVSLTIQPSESIGFVGRTGAGKTTLADIVLGLHEPDSGTVTIDDLRLTKQTSSSWQRRVGYVPQSVFLSNASVAENIALGLSREQIDVAALHRAARMAQAEEFISGLPQGYESVIGERGVKLSGGQRQRIGIARALYHGPDVLVFDEATSALDGLTEDAVMESIRGLARDRTIILIAHRLRTVEACDRIVMLERGEIIAIGSYNELLAASNDFRHFVGRRKPLAVNQ